MINYKPFCFRNLQKRRIMRLTRTSRALRSQLLNFPRIKRIRPAKILLRKERGSRFRATARTGRNQIRN